MHLAQTSNSNFARQVMALILHPAVLHSHTNAFQLLHCAVDATTAICRRPRNKPDRPAAAGAPVQRQQQAAAPHQLNPKPQQEHTRSSHSTRACSCQQMAASSAWPGAQAMAQCCSAQHGRSPVTSAAELHAVARRVHLAAVISSHYGPHIRHPVHAVAHTILKHPACCKVL